MRGDASHTFWSFLSLLPWVWLYSFFCHGNIVSTPFCLASGLSPFFYLMELSLVRHQVKATPTGGALRRLDLLPCCGRHCPIKNGEEMPNPLQKGSIMDDKENSLFTTNYVEREPKKPVSPPSPYNAHFVIVLIFFMLVVVLISAIRLMPIDMVRGTIDTLITIGMLGSVVGLSVSIAIWFETF